MHTPAVDRAAWASPWRHRSVGDKALLALGLLAVALAAPRWWGSLVVLAVAVAAAVAYAGVSVGLFARALVVPAAFIGVGAASIAVTLGAAAPGAYWRLGPLSATPETLTQAGEVAARGLAGTAAVLLLACTTPMVDLLEALRRLGVPDPLIEVASLTYRLLFTLIVVAETVRTSQASRHGYDSWATSWRSTGTLASAVLVRSWDRARRLEDGLAGRGFTGALRTLNQAPARSARFEAGAVGVLAVVVAVVLVAPRVIAW